MRYWLKKAALRRAIIVAALAVTAICPARAAPGASAPDSSASGSSEWARTDQTQLRLVSATAAAGEAATLRLGLEFKLEPGWKIYWRSPGDAGLPPKLDWAGSRNLADAAIRWPAPERFELFGFDTFGYGGGPGPPVAPPGREPGAPVARPPAGRHLV